MLQFVIREIQYKYVFDPINDFSTFGNFCVMFGFSVYSDGKDVHV
jgi:hypothetical protein